MLRSTFSEENVDRSNSDKDQTVESADAVDGKESETSG